MKTNYNEFLNESVNINTVELAKKINTLKRWILIMDGLGMMSVIDSIMRKNYESEVTPDLVEKFYIGLSELKKTDFPNIKWYLNRSVPNGVEKKTIVKINGKWSHLNKLNGNYSDQSEILAYLIDKMVNDPHHRVREEFGIPAYEKIKNGNIEEGLLVLKPKLKGIIEYYFIKKGNGLNDFLRFTDNIKTNSKRGERAEDIAVDFLEKNNFEIKYRGGDGDYIDMVFGCDLIVYREDIGYKTIQVKTFMPKQKDIHYYKVNWIVVSNVNSGGSVVLDKETLRQVDIY